MTGAGSTTTCARRGSTNGYGFRVPGLVISPYARRHYIDHQQLSFDAYAKFIEDDFLGGQRLNPKTDGRPDPRPDVRENAQGLGDLRQGLQLLSRSRADRRAPAPVSEAPHEHRADARAGRAAGLRAGRGPGGDAQPRSASRSAPTGSTRPTGSAAAEAYARYAAAVVEHLRAGRAAGC